MNKPGEVIVKTCKYDGRPHRSWKAEILEQSEGSLVLLGVFDKRIEHSQLGIIQPGTLSYEYYWFDRWYNVFRFHEPDGTLRNYYCNINMPPKFADGILSYVDLDIDLLVSPAFDMKILDLDEFEENKTRYGYPEELVKKTLSTLDEVRNLIAHKMFPFSPE